MKAERRRFNINLSVEKHNDIIEYLEKSGCISKTIISALTEQMNRKEVKKWQRPKQ